MSQEDSPAWIDVWDVSTFDGELCGRLEHHAEVIRAYWTESRRLFLEREAETLRGPPKENVHWGAYARLQSDIEDLMSRRTIRAWHFTRLTDPEVDAIRTSGMQLMSTELVARRLDAQVTAGVIDRATADALYAASPFHRQTCGNREGRIWLTAQPYQIDDSGVRLLLGSWGGESVNFAHLDGPMHSVLASIGQPCVVEVALPLAITTRIESAAENVIDAYALTLGVNGGWGGGADIVAVAPIEPGWVLNVHRPGTPSFDKLGCGYPERFQSDDD